MTNFYKLKGGHRVKDFQLFQRTYPVSNCDELHTATYFVHREQVYSLKSETGKPSECNFNAGYLNKKYGHTFQPLDEFYEGTVDEDGRLVMPDD
ncbi:MAG: hypothetical protein FWH04_04610 [Oscillospiraceae bacterium]|nr:hypothetical protein [Oscillospiraceae bacterium]